MAARAKEMEFLDVVSDVTAEIELGALLQRVMIEATRMLNADRATLFLKSRTDELFLEFMGDGIGEIRLPNNAGIAYCFSIKKTVNIPHAYVIFNPSFDNKLAIPRSILCVPIMNKEGDCIGCAQALNKVGGGFADEDNQG